MKMLPEYSPMPQHDTNPSNVKQFPIIAQYSMTFFWRTNLKMTRNIIGVMTCTLGSKNLNYDGCNLLIPDRNFLDRVYQLSKYNV